MSTSNPLVDLLTVQVNEIREIAEKNRNVLRDLVDKHNDLARALKLIVEKLDDHT